MSLPGLMAGIALLAAAAAWVLLPLIRSRQPDRATLLDRQRERALAYYERALTNIRDLDEDHATGKIDPEEYQMERERWVDRGVKVLQLLEQLDSNQVIVASANPDEETIDRAIEETIYSYRRRTTRAGTE